MLPCVAQEVIKRNYTVLWWLFRYKGPNRNFNVGNFVSTFTSQIVEEMQAGLFRKRQLG